MGRKYPANLYGLGYPSTRLLNEQAGLGSQSYGVIQSIIVIMPWLVTPLSPPIASPFLGFALWAKTSFNKE